MLRIFDHKAGGQRPPLQSAKLEIQAKLSLNSTGPAAFTANLAPWRRRVCRVDRETRRIRLRVVQDVRHISAERQGLRFGQTERLAQVSIPTINRQIAQDIAAQVALLTGLRIL